MIICILCTIYPLRQRQLNCPFTPNDGTTRRGDIEILRRNSSSSLVTASKLSPCLPNIRAFPLPRQGHHERDDPHTRLSNIQSSKWRCWTNSRRGTSVSLTPPFEGSPPRLIGRSRNANTGVQASTGNGEPSTTFSLPPHVSIHSHSSSMRYIFVADKEEDNRQDGRSDRTARPGRLFAEPHLRARRQIDRSWGDGNPRMKLKLLTRDFLPQVRCAGNGPRLCVRHRKYLHF